VLAADPGPFTAELAAVRLSFPKAELQSRVLTVIGSASALTRRQMETLRLAHSAHIVRVDWRRLLNSAERQAEIELVLEKIISGAQRASVLGVCTAEKDDEVFSLTELAKTLGLSPEEISASVNSALAFIAEKLLAHIIVTDTVCSSPSLSGIIPNMEIVSSSEFSAMVLETIARNGSITELVQIHGVDGYFANI
jgi:uncharacterized protein YgbK (DUF1537 family)